RQGARRHGGCAGCRWRRRALRHSDPRRHRDEEGRLTMASILIADDEARISGFISKGLRAAGFAVQVAENGPDALDLALTGEFDLMVLDVNMPGFDGFHVLEQLRGSGSKLPVIMLTARVELQDTIAGLEGGADDYLGKPFRFDELLARI